MGCGGGSIVWVVRGNGAIGVMHQLGRGTSNKERADYLKKVEMSEWAELPGLDAPTHTNARSSFTTNWVDNTVHVYDPPLQLDGW